MGSINQSPTKTAPRTHEGGRAVRIDAEAQLRRTVMACLLWEDTFYEDGVSVADRIAEGVKAVPQETAAQIAIEAREQMYLRHVPLLIVREMARYGGSIVGDTLARVIQRADELTEFLAIYWKDDEHQPLSAQVKRGLAEAFPKFDAYQLAKYDRAKAVRLRDVLFLTHPKPRDEEQQEVWTQLTEGTLPAPDTWEVALSTGGDPKEHWTRLLTETRTVGDREVPALGDMALLRNLRNMRQANVTKKLIVESLDARTFGRVLPFRFIAAAEAAPDFEPALERAMFRAIETLTPLEGKTAIVVDRSGSMNAAMSEKSVLRRFDAAVGLAIMAREMGGPDNVDVVAFGHDAKLVPPRRGFALRDAIRSANVGWSTYGEKGHQVAKKRGYDRVILITDEQLHDNLSHPLPGTTAYMINVASYRNGVGYGPWTHIDGWSDGVFRYIQEVEAAAE